MTETPRQSLADRSRLAQDASPQTGKGHGHTEISNELLEAIYAYPFTSVQFRVVLFIIRDSYGWKRKETRAYNFPEIAGMINAERTIVFRAFAQLDRLGVLQRADNGGWALVKNYKAWGNTPELPLSIVAGQQPLLGSNGTTLLGSNGMVAGRQRRVAGQQRYMEKERERKKERGTDPQDLPNGQTDTPRHRAELGHEDHAPEDHPDFKRLGFKIQEDFAAIWKESREKARKAAACRKCEARPRASETWAFCRPCTACAHCGATKGNFTAIRNEIVCNDCKNNP